MEDYRLIQIEEEFEDEDEDYNDGEYDEDLIPEGIVPPRDSNLIINAGEEEDFDDDDDDDEDEQEEDYEEGEEGDELIPLAIRLHDGSIDDEDYEDEDEDDEDHEDEDEDGEHYYEEEEEEEEVEELIPVEMISPRVSSSRTLLREVVINENVGGNGGNEELNTGEIDGLFCPICFEAWTSGGDHQICCLPCGHIYGSSCIKKWLQQRRSSGRCPQCNNVCTLKDVRVLYATRLCVADEELHKRVRSLEAKCSYLEQKDKYKVEDGCRGEFETYLEGFKAHRKAFETYRQEFMAFRQEFYAYQAECRQELGAIRQEFEAHRRECVAHRQENPTPMSP